jgi:hypothetical protein
MTKPTAANTRNGAATKVTEDPSKTVFSVLTGDIGRAALKTLPVATQALLVETLLEQSRSQFFDANNGFTGVSFSSIVMELLGTDKARTQSVMAAMRKRGAYSNTGTKSKPKIAFTGTRESKDILNEVEAARIPEPALASDSGLTARPNHQSPVRHIAGPTTEPYSPSTKVDVGRGATVVVVLGDLPSLGRSDARLVGVLADRTFADTDGDREVIIGLIHELATRLS